MEKTPYHHGNLHETLLEEGMALIHEDGLAQFSLRKLAKRVGVSPTACYNHFPNADALISEIKEYVDHKFVEAIQRGIRNSFNNPKKLMVELGKEYVAFFADNPHYFSFLYDDDTYQITLTDTDFTGDYLPFTMFRDAGIQIMQSAGIPEDHFKNNLVIMWAAVHGLAAMANMKAFHFTGDWKELTEIILTDKLRIE